MADHVRAAVPVSVRDIADRYDAFLLDQYGVIHNGVVALPGSVDTVKELASRGKTMMVLSNSTVRSRDTLARLATLGFPTTLFSGAMTAGEHAWGVIRELRKQGSLGKKCLWLGKTNMKGIHRSFVSGLDLDLVGSAEEADFILLQGYGIVGLGSKDERVVNYDYEKVGEAKGCLREALCAAAKRRLPMYCLNPDKVAVQPDGSLAFVTGKVADNYSNILLELDKCARLSEEGWAEEIVVFGKPTKACYENCLAILHRDHGIKRDKVLMIGDSLSHDIRGAANGKIDSLLVAGGIHKDVLLAPAAARAESSSCNSSSAMQPMHSILNTASRMLLVAGSLAMGVFMIGRTTGVGSKCSLPLSFAAAAICASGAGSMSGMHRPPRTTCTRIAIEGLPELCQKYNATPSYITDHFKW